MAAFLAGVWFGVRYGRNTERRRREPVPRPLPPAPAPAPAPAPSYTPPRAGANVADIEAARTAASRTEQRERKAPPLTPRRYLDEDTSPHN